MVNNLDYVGVKFPVPKKDFGKIEKKNDICSNVFCYENDFVYPVHTPDKKLEHCTDLLMITDKNKSNFVYIKNSNKYMCNKTKNKNKSTFANIDYNVLVAKKFL